VRIPFRVPPPDERPFDVVGQGLNSVDLIAVVAEYPASNSKHQLQRLARLPGGPIATAMVTCARLGWRARYIGRFGSDDLGAISRASLVAADVDVTEAAIVNEATNQFAVILVDARSGHRTVLWDRHASLTMRAADVPHSAIRSGRILIVDCQETEAAAEAAKCARRAGIVTIVDVEKVRPGIGELLQQIDAIVAAESFPAELTGYAEPGRALEAIAHEFNAPVVCVTLGDGGSLARSGGREIRTPGFVVDCLDTTGAGDVFRGAFAAGCLRTPAGDLEDVLEYANATAALNCRALGAQGGIPGHREVESLLAGRRRTGM
jgi:sugar/nucleoside kinase (ribokinase family)